MWSIVWPTPVAADDLAALAVAGLDGTSGQRRRGLERHADHPAESHHRRHGELGATGGADVVVAVGHDQVGLAGQHESERGDGS